MILAAALMVFGAAVAEAKGGLRYAHPHHFRGSNIAPWIAGGMALGILGAGIAAQQYYLDTCHWERRRVFDEYGRFIGWQRVRICD